MDVDEEEVILEYPGGLFLTNRAIYLDTAQLGRRHLVSIMIEQLCSCEVHHVSQPFLLALAAISLIGGAYGGVAAGELWPLIAGLVGAFVFLVLYLISRRQVLTFASAGATIHLPSTQPVEMAIDFIDAVETVKHERYLLRCL